MLKNGVEIESKKIKLEPDRGEINIDIEI